MSVKGFFFITFFVLSKLTFTQDTLKYVLDEITIKSGLVLEAKQVIKIDSRNIEKSDASSVDELAIYIPSVKIQTNSRGENLYYIRGAGERQIALFFDGAPINVPWDNRIDLSLIPTEAIGEMTITKGIPSMIYGANTPAGVVNIQSKEYCDEMSKGKISTQFGQNNFQRYSGYWLDGNKNFSYLLSTSYKNTKGYNLPVSYSDSNNLSQQRINSYSKSINTFGKVTYNFTNFSNLGLSISYIDSKKGVPPETDVEQIRYWKYPDWKKLGINLNGVQELEKDKNSFLTYSFSFTKFNMQIDQYADITFSNIDDIERDNDYIYYGRLIYTKLFGVNHLFKFSGSGYTTTHKEDFLSSSYIEDKYSQNLYSVGCEYEFIQPTYSIILGGSFDGVSTPSTGPHPAREPFSDYSAYSAFVYSFSPSFSTKFNIGRKTRFPTLRESYSGALGKFVINPDLKAENALTTEISADYKYSLGKTNLSVFLTYLKDGIIKTKIAGGKSMRINKDNIRTFGIELTTSLTPFENLYCNVNLTLMNTYAKNNEGEYKDTLDNRPDFLGAIIVDYYFLNGFNINTELTFKGNEYQYVYDKFKKMNSYILLNLRLSYKFKLDNSKSLEAFIRFNNIFDKLYFHQWSLPEAGRQIWFGASLDF
ncbi:MAG: TonB-dependent receptor plug domain-containing protein [Ignavibacteriales bacterium]|nr:TonB-dependent receptor plug domain-containing protein [Ignavibacteriales bacterium]